MTIDGVNRSVTPAPAPSAEELKPVPLTYTADQASPAAAIDSVKTDAAKGNMVANMHGGWVPDKRGIVRIVTKTHSSRSKKNGSRSKSRTIRRGGKRATRSRTRIARRRFRKQGSSFKRRVSRRIRMRLLERHIKKRRSTNSNMQKMMRGGDNDAAAMGGGEPVPQHGASCVPDAPNCAGNAAASLLTANRQATANAHGDSITNNPNP
jgi:hypothetical protein